MADQELRQFEDADGRGWAIHVQEAFKWQFVPLEGDGPQRRIVTPPPGADDPRELSEEELGNLLESGIPASGITEPLAPDTG